MKLTFYGLWEDERPKLNELTQKYGFECVATNDVLSMDNAALCKGARAYPYWENAPSTKNFCALYTDTGSGICLRAVSDTIIST